MTQNSAVSAESPPDVGHRLTGNLGTASIVFMVVAVAAPLTVVAGASINLLISNGPGITFAYAVGTLIMCLFITGFCAMTPHVKNPGAFYSYVGEGIGPRAGAGAAFVAMLTYFCVQVGVYAYMGFMLGDLVQKWTGGAAPEIPWWAYVAAGIVVTAYFSYRNIDLSAKVLAFALITEAALVLIINVAVVLQGGGPEGLSATSWLAPEVIFTPALGLAVMFGIGVFMGIESTAIFRDEARNPERTIPRATYIAVIGTGIFYVLALWSLLQAWGVNGLVPAAEQNPGDLYLATAAAFLGKVFSEIVQVFLIISMFACVLSLQNVTSRYMHSLANAGLLPGKLGIVHEKHRSPSFASLVSTGVVTAALLVWVLLGMDPVLQVFPWHIAVGTISVMALFVITSIAVIRYFRRTKADTRPWQTLVAPALAVAVIGLVLVLTYANFGILTGEVPAITSIALQVLPVVAFLIGVALDRRRRSRNLSAALQ
ncbi:APC family permease [Arthrobacter sp. GCM10027362]|uniref:APC family permease n=1 Tax=Arthrobacter sp. GCM10027362 TaxID=3273379 RepID=UPI003645F0B3